MSVQSKKRLQGFTLVELMIVIAIIGVIASAAIPAFIQYQARSRTAEAKSNLASLVKAQTGYFAESGEYIGELVPCPGLPGPYPGTAKQQWMSVRSTLCDFSSFFEVLGWYPEGGVFYDYGSATENSWAATGAGGAFFVAYAVGDVDGDGDIAVMAYVRPDVGGSYDMSVCTFCSVDPPLDMEGNPILNMVAAYRIDQGFDDF